MLSCRSVPWDKDQFTIGLGVNALSGEPLARAFPDSSKLKSRAELDNRPAHGDSQADYFLNNRSEDYAKAFGFASDVHGGAYFGEMGGETVRYPAAARGELPLPWAFQHASLIVSACSWSRVREGSAPHDHFRSCYQDGKMGV